MKKHFLKRWNNERGYIFPLTSFILLILLLFTFHQIQQLQHQQKVNELNHEQFRLEMLYQKAYASLHLEVLEETSPPFQYTFPDGNVTIHLFNVENREIYQMELTTHKGSSRIINIELND
ncbi:hypothetical protein [Gracilibacillus massiliensis]|uniref:hypothetical protein n=1 Tax=Gracilibacillus massiliensis TaxID=1564956 RepID=UPI00071CFC09|nr:hypothetical protein [Gracilibacillus massiliensis]